MNILPEPSFFCGRVSNRLTDKTHDLADGRGVFAREILNSLGWPCGKYLFEEEEVRLGRYSLPKAKSFKNSASVEKGQ